MKILYVHELFGALAGAEANLGDGNHKAFYDELTKNFASLTA